VSMEILGQLENSRSFTLPCLNGRRIAAKLGNPKAISEVVYHPIREAEKIAFGRSHPMQRPFNTLNVFSHL
ncbi:hypothetical protein JZU51_01800, partial [bacterium]|nr:hypothetical protein [bacterium]